MTQRLQFWIIAILLDIYLWALFAIGVSAYLAAR